MILGNVTFGQIRTQSLSHSLSIPNRNRKAKSNHGPKNRLCSRPFPFAFPPPPAPKIPETFWISNGIFVVFVVLFALATGETRKAHIGNSTLGTVQ